MDIPHQNDASRKLFHSVDHLQANCSTVVFTCMPTLESEARNMVASLVTYLKHKHRDEVMEFFTKDAQIHTLDSYWDEEQQCICNPDDAHISSLLNDINVDYIMPPTTKGPNIVNAMQAPERPIPGQQPGTQTPHTLQCNTFGEEEDSIGTFHQQQDHDTATVTSNDSNSTMESLTARLAALEHLLRSNNIIIPTNLKLEALPHMPIMGPPAGTISNQAGHIARWQQLLNSYSMNGGRGHLQGNNRRRLTRPAGRGGLGTTADGFRQ
jgi:hypothetical protein